MGKTAMMSACKPFAKCKPSFDLDQYRILMLMSFRTIETVDSEAHLSFAVALESDVSEKDEEKESDESKGEKTEPSTSFKDSKKTTKIVDPLRWFGILVPPTLRSAQSGFVSAVDGPIPQLATVVRDLRSQEIEIGRVKKQIKKLGM